MALKGVYGTGYQDSVDLSPMDTIYLDSVVIFTHVITVSPGTHVIARSGEAKLRALGGGTFLGTATDSIWFYPQQGLSSWDGLDLDHVYNVVSDPEPFHLAYIDLRGAGGSVGGDSSTMVHSRFHHGGGAGLGGVGSRYSHLLVDSNNGGGFQSGNDVHTSYSVVEHNTEFSIVAVGTFVNNIIRHNSAPDGKGTASCCDVFVGNVVVQNSARGALRINGNNDTIINTTLVGNTGHSGGGAFFQDGGTAVCINSIVAGNSPDDGGCNPSSINTGTGTGALFTQGSEHYYDLSSDPSNFNNIIDGGSNDTFRLDLPLLDVAGRPRISGARIDRGAYEYQHPGAIDSCFYYGKDCPDNCKDSQGTIYPLCEPDCNLAVNSTHPICEDSSTSIYTRNAGFSNLYSTLLPQIHAFPTANGSWTLVTNVLATPAGSEILSLYTLQGKRIHTSTHTLSPGGDVQWNIGHIRPGLYIAKWTHAGTQQQGRVHLAP